MKKPRNEKRVVNLPKEDFDTIKSYCDKNALNMPKWMTKVALEKFQNLPQKYFNIECGEDRGDGRYVVARAFVDTDVIQTIYKLHGAEAAKDAWWEMYKQTFEKVNGKV